MKKYILLLNLIYLSAFSAEPSMTEVLQPDARLNPWRFQAGGMVVGAADSSRLLLGSGVFVNASHRASENSPIFIGLETGLLDTQDLASTIAAALLFPLLLNSEYSIDSVRTIPVLGSAIIRDDTGGFHFYGGVAIGPTLQHITAHVIRSGERRSRTDLGVMAIFRGGADIDLTDDVAVNLELLRFGLMQDTFAYLPALSLSASF